MLRSTLSHLTLVPDEPDGPRPLEIRATETLWARLRQEAQEAVAHEPMLAPLFFNSILNQPSFEAAIFHRIASRLGTDVVRPSAVADVFRRAVSFDPEIGHAVRADIAAVVDRDPACDRFIEPFLYFKGFHAIQAHRVAHWL
jgi:serine O-acetyltransferase